MGSFRDQELAKCCCRRTSTQSPLIHTSVDARERPFGQQSDVDISRKLITWQSSQLVFYIVSSIVERQPDMLVGPFVCFDSACFVLSHQMGSDRLLTAPKVSTPYSRLVLL